MKKILQSIIITGLFFMMPLPVVVYAKNISLAEYRNLTIRYSILLGAENVTAQLEALSREQWQYLYDLTPSKAELMKATTDLEKLAQEANKKAETSGEGRMLPQFIDPNATVVGEFEPRYPDVYINSESCITNPAGCYGNYILIPSLLGFFAPDSGESGIQDDRCNEHAEAIERDNHLYLHELAIAAQAGCDMASLGFELVACPAAAAAWSLDNASQELVTACEVHTGNVDSAEIEAAYENTRTILNEVNNETKFIDDNELAAHETAIKSAISTHDTDIKEQLALIKNSLAQQKAQLDEIIRLLKTPQGKRPNWNK